MDEGVDDISDDDSTVMGEDPVDRHNMSSFSQGFLSKSYDEETILVGDMVSESLRDKIWDDVMVDFVELLSLDEQRQCPFEKFPNSQNKMESRRVIKDIGLWNRAFNTFSTVYLSKPSNRKYKKDIATYLNYIWDLKDASFDWAKYDYLYREERCSEKHKKSWRRHVNTCLISFCWTGYLVVLQVNHL